MKWLLPEESQLPSLGIPAGTGKQQRYRPLTRTRLAIITWTREIDPTNDTEH